MWEVARSTSAAPTYFSSYHLRPEDVHLVDGGLWANNPSVLVTGHLMQLSSSGHPSNIKLLSLGTGEPETPLSIPVSTGKLDSIRQVLDELIDRKSVV